MSNVRAHKLKVSMPYDHFEHRHRFAVWAGARAAQRAFAKVEQMRDALESTDIRTFVETPISLNVEADEFNAQHKKWCHQIIEHLTQNGIAGATYGRAAKLVAVYFKTMVVVGAGSSSKLAQVVHPPIDRVLLRNLSSCKSLPPTHKTLWRSTAWTKLNESEYFALLASLRSVVLAPQAWWLLEEYWTVTNE